MGGPSSRTRAGQKRTESKAVGKSRLRELREEAELSQEELGERAGIHRNTIYNLEKGVTKEITAEGAAALAAALRVRPRDLGLNIRRAAPRSVRFRQLTTEQRQLVDELLTFAPEHFSRIRAALEHVRRSMKRKRSRKA